MKNQIAYVVPVNDVVRLKFAVSQSINRLQNKQSLNECEIAILKELIELEHKTNVDNYRITRTK